jgi:DNA ligase (NAD+)
MLDINKLIDDPQKYTKKLSNDEIVDILETLSDAYYNTGESMVSDEIYDQIIDILKKRDPDNKYFSNVGAPIKGTKELVTLPFEMGSLSKIKPGGDDLEKWMKKFKGPYHLSDKLDGVSAQIYKNPSGEIFMYSRGDGVEGQNISHLLKYVVDKKVLKKLPESSSIRGELIISRSDFKKIEDQMKNARNAVAGLVNAKNFNKDVAKITKFIAYSILNPRYYYHEQMKLLKEYGFDIVINKQIKKLNEDLLKEYLTDRRKNSDYEIDGIVCVDDSIIYSHSGGYPEHSFAFKMITEDQIAKTKVVKVHWKPSKDGYLKPRIEIEPVNLVGTTVTYATAFNAKYIVDNNIGEGAEIKIIRSGDVIPYILEVVKGAKNGSDMPDFPYKWNSSKVDLILKDDDDDNQGKQIVKIELLVHFFSTIGVKFLSKGIITKLVENDYDSIEDILKARKKDLAKIEGLGEKIIDKIYDEIDRAFEEITLEIFMGASNKLGRGLNSKKLKEVIDVYPNLINDFEDLDEDEIKEKILKVQGFSDKLATQFSENYENFIKFYKDISKLKNLSRFEKIEVKKKGGIFDDKIFVFTGFRDKDMEKFIIDNGGKTSSSVSGNTYMLIHADDADINSSKFVKAKEKGTKIIKKSDFIKQFMK